MLEKLNQYKEIITIMVFFLGGFIWMENQFPTKTYLSSQVKLLSCELQEYMKITQLEDRELNLQNEIQDRNGEIQALSASGTDPHGALSPIVEQELAARNLQVTNDTNELNQDNVASQATWNDIEAQKCAQ